MKGVVNFFNITKGVGFVDGEDGVSYFVHESSIRQASGIRFLLPGWKVEFKPGKGEKGAKAFEVVPLDETGVVRNDPDRLGFCEPTSHIPLHIDALGRVYVGTHVLTSTTEGRSKHGFQTGAFRAYYVGSNRFSGFNLVLPEATANAVFVLLAPDKALRRGGNHYPQTAVGSYLVKVARDGQVTVWNLGVRIQNGTNHWVVVERRFHHRYDFGKLDAGDIRSGLEEQTPTSDLRGVKRDNDGFIPAVERALEKMGQAAQAA